MQLDGDLKSNLPQLAEIVKIKDIITRLGIPAGTIDHFNFFFKFLEVFATKFLHGEFQMKY